MINENIKIHDKYQFEIKYNYPLGKEKQPSSYDIETYFFIPNSLGVNKYTYRKDDFYNDIQAYIRFKTPTVLLKNLVCGENNPLENLRINYRRVIQQRDKYTEGLYEYHSKMFCCILKSSLREQVDFMAATTVVSDLQQLILEYIESIRKITAGFRELRAIINIPGIDKRLFSIYLFADEYISHLIEMYTHNLIDIVNKRNDKQCLGCKSDLINLIRNEIDHRKENGYPSIPNRDGDNEELLFRRGVLKKFMESILFLYMHASHTDKIVEQILFGFAAGLAMLFATAIAFFTQSKFGSYSMPVFMVIVVAYVFKDRIKELLRIYLSKKISNVLYDFKFNIFSGPKDKIGYSKTSVDFLSEHQVPAEIKKIRNRDHITEIENGWIGEKILYYRKNLKILSKNFRRVYRSFEIDGINDIIRFNIFKFLQKMDDPKKYLFIAGESDHQKIFGERVYHLNIVMKYTKETESVYKRFRIVLNRSGIKRIEEVRV